ncbi:MAG: hypothetical protein A6D92_08450 [Symbiobacterium thermophilum]|uniref:Uncharacterized protein n=1 Tax=Symbiobacterium thermophilum TaxID=2734 RepID=A0A1Y2T450_SYMTR|nr:MAG: hypothetical protein A6D92_08450 [Symbiobacterium thermophilum]
MLLEIISEAVVGRAEHTLTWTHTLPADGVVQVLGVRPGPSKARVRAEGGSPQAEVTVDVDLWFLGQDGTRVTRTRCQTVQPAPVALRGNLLSDPSYDLRLLGNARTTDVRVEDGSVHLDMAVTVEVEARALTRYWVRAEDHVPAR